MRYSAPGHIQVLYATAITFHQLMIYNRVIRVIHYVR